LPSTADKIRSLPFATTVGALLLASSLGAQTPSWKQFSSPADGFRAEFPSEPERSKNGVPVAGEKYELRSYTVESGSTALSVAVCDYGAKAVGANPEQILANAEQGSLDHTTAHLVSEKRFVLDTSPAIANRGIEFEAETDQLHFSVHLVLAGGVLYQAMVTTPLNARSADGVRFLDSFNLLPRASAVASPTALTLDWKPYPYPADGFSASFPSQPKVQKQDILTDSGKVEMRTYDSDQGSAEFIAAVCDYGPTAQGKDPDTLIANAEKGAVNNLKAHLVREKSVSLGTIRGVEFEADSDTAHVAARIYLVGSVLYQMIVASPLNARPDDTSRFLESFQLLTTHASR
jgi:hypothetical protein